MQQFVVPQFIEVEDKIFGPITVRQFIILLVALGLIFIANRLADTTLFIVLLALIGGLALIIAFVKINGQSFHYFLLNIIQSTRRPSLRIWRKEYSKEELDFLRKADMNIEKEKEPVKRPVRREKIRDLALLVNTGGFYKPEDDA